MKIENEALVTTKITGLRRYDLRLGLRGLFGSSPDGNVLLGATLLDSSSERTLGWELLIDLEGNDFTITSTDEEHLADDDLPLVAAAIFRQAGQYAAARTIAEDYREDGAAYKEILATISEKMEATV